jgi:hypothetical protein
MSGSGTKSATDLWKTVDDPSPLYFFTYSQLDALGGFDAKFVTADVSILLEISDLSRVRPRTSSSEHELHSVGA